MNGYSSAQGSAPLYASATLPNGTNISFGAPGANAVYPTLIRDANYLTITYQNNSGPQIETIPDTLGQTIQFYYGSNNLLTAITAPELTSGTRTLVRLQYQDLTLSYNYTTKLTPRVRNGPIQVIKAIYYPSTATGYWFGDGDSYSTLYRSERAMGSAGGQRSRLLH